MKISIEKCGGNVKGVINMEKPEIEFKRKIYEKMIEWKQKRTPDYALFLKGPRRVGKSTLASKLGREQYKSFIEIRFDKAPEEIKNLFVNSLEDLDDMFEKIQIHYKTKLYRRESLIILDEIQLFPEARQALKTLLEDKRYDYIETGSLASIKRNSKKILKPSEEYTLNVYPLDFEEFLTAIGDEITFNVLKSHFESLKPLGAAHSQIKKLFRTYMLVGGMPQSVLAYIKTKDFGDVDFAKQQILDLYEGDMNDQEEENPDTLKNIFWHIPSELSKHDKKFMLSHIDPNARIRDYKGAIGWLNDAMILNMSENVSEISTAFNLSTIDPYFKCYLMDTGLLISLAFKNKDYLENELYEAILFDKLHVNEGMIVENAIAQAIRTKGERIYYFKKIDNESKKTIAELDFLVRRGNKINIIEAKSSKSNSIKSIDYVKTTYPKRIGKCYILHDGDIKIEKELIYLPYYFASLI